MKIQDFLRDSLQQILEGVAEARRKNGKIGGRIKSLGKQDASCTLSDEQAGFLVNFDIAVTVSEKTCDGIEAGIHIASFFKAGANMAGTSEQSSVSRIQFSVPIIFQEKAEDLVDSKKSVESMPR